MNTPPRLALVLSLLASAACSGSTQSAPPPAANAAAEDNTPAPATWSEELSKEQKASIMKQRVVPAQAQLFKEVDATKFGEFGCKTCHGPDRKKPSDHLPHLVMKDGHITAFAEKPEVAKFMAEKVVPAMATALGVQPFDMKTGQGFGCHGCHAVDMQ
ncbi:MAG: hypothetical protein U1E65_29170 [Myxococcota bacterium]